jgi:hypothetical protein
VNGLLAVTLEVTGHKLARAFGIVGERVGLPCYYACGRG